MTYGLGVEDDETYPVLLDRMSERLEVLNLGVQGYPEASSPCCCAS